MKLNIKGSLYQYHDHKKVYSHKCLNDTFFGNNCDLYIYIILNLISVKGLWRAGWNEVPTIMATLPFMFIGLAIGTVGIHLYNKYDYDNRQHKLRYVGKFYFLL